jgi:hypothetical protein
VSPKLFPRLFIFLPTLVLTLALILPACGAPAYPAAPAPEEPAPAEEPPAAPSPTSTPPIISPTQAPAQPAIPESRRLTLEFPPRMKAGVESDLVRLTLEMDDLGNITPTAQIGGHVVTGEVIQIPNLYETHFVTAEARIDMVGMDIQPSGPTYEPMKQGQSVTFFWSVRPPEPGRYRGTVWFHINFVDKVSGEDSRLAVSAQIVEIEAVDFFGFSVNFVRTSGVVGSLLGVIVGFPFFDDFLKFLFNKTKKRRRVVKRRS